MKILLLPVLSIVLFASCNNSSKTAKTFCDTNCNSTSFDFKGTPEFGQSLSISVKNCTADTVTWTHGKAATSSQVQLSDFLNQPVKLNKSAISCAFQDTSFIWLAFNDCVTGRGYLLKMTYKKTGILKMTGALNAFDPKFSIDPDLRAYTDRGNIYVVNVNTGKQAQMTFKKEYEMDFNNVHKAIDTLNVSKQRVYIKLIDKNGTEVPLEKKIEL
ncbi:MAG TPA: hypothetical protein VNR87_15540 [Flavisolibacter sp.]|nr:hypothetical protein [Flavisolibacter sp.]